jgi:two-component system, OmpR family, response regulator MprA
MAKRPPSSNPGGSEDTLPILVVDDDPEYREVIQTALEAEGWAVATARDGQQALDQAVRCRPRLVVLDIGLPRVDGHGVATGLRTVYGDTVPIVVVTADGHIVEKAQRVRARAHLAKPFDLDDLCATVRHALAGS